VVLALFFLFAVVTTPKPPALSQADATNLVLNDLDNLLAAGAEVTFVSISPSADYAWEMELKIVEGPHSRCPKVFKRYYTFSPFGYRPETILTDCVPPSPIIYPEEALIAAGKDYTVASMALPQGCAFLLKEYAAEEARESCPWFDEDSFNAFSRGLEEGVWVTQWADCPAAACDASLPGSCLVAVDSMGVLLKRECAA